MDEIIFIIVIILIAIGLIPIITFIRLNSISKDVDHLNNSINELNKKLVEVSKQALNKKDADGILNAINELKEKMHSVPTTVNTSVEPVNEITPSAIPPIAKVSTNKEIDLHKNVVETVSKKVEIEKEIAPAASEPKKEVLPKSVPPLVAFARDETEKKKSVISDIPPVYSSPKTNTQPVQETDNRNFIEKILGENWLSKVGIITLVLGIGFFVKYAIDQEWINEIGRVGIGLLTGAILIGIAHKLKSQYHVFSSLLVGGGISTFYMTITLAFREYQLFDQTIAFIILIAITVFSVILSLFYDRKELAIFSLLGGFASPLMVSTGTGNYIVLFSYILILNTGMLFVSFQKKWRVIGMISYALTLIFFWSWTLMSYQMQYFGATLFSVLFFIQFYVLALIDHFKSEKKITAYQAILILTNNLSLFVACLYIFDTYPYDVRGIITIAVAVVNAVVMVVLFKKSSIDRNLIYLIIAVVMSFISLAIPIQLRGYAITMFWAAESVLLLWLWQKSQIKVFRIGFLVVSVLVILSYVIDIQRNYGQEESLSIALNSIFITGLVVIAGFVINSFLLKKEDTESTIQVGGIELFSVDTFINIFRAIVILLIFIVPYLELNYQLERFTDTEYSASFRYLALASYLFVYITAVIFIYRNKISSKALYLTLLLFSIAFYAVVNSYLSTDLRFDTFYLNEYTSSYFLIHLIALPIVVFAFYLFIKNIKSLPSDIFQLFCWAGVILSVIILSVETDNLVILLFGHKENYDALLYDVHTFGYPILWGVIAMILMIWGLNKKEVLLRKISLLFFGAIILKFYAYDVWHMSQAGRIISFVLLGVILLLVSFLQQKIKTLVKEDSPLESINQEENEMP